MSRAALIAVLVALGALLAVGCGGGGGGETEPASVAPAGAPLFARLTIQPQGEAKTDIEALAKNVAGVGDLGGLIVSKLEESAGEEGESFDFEREVEPWLGEEAGFFAEDFAGSNFTHYGVAIQTSDEEASRKFVEKVTEGEDEPAKDGSYEGVDFKLTGDGKAVGVFDGVLAIAEGEAVFRDMVDASEGESLADSKSFSEAISAAPGQSVADVFVDVGGLIRRSGGKISPETSYLLEAAGIEARESSAVASLVPASNSVEIDLSTDFAPENPPSGDPSQMLASLPGTAVGAFAFAEFGQGLKSGIDRLDAKGIPGKVPPHQLKQGLKQAGIDLESIASSIGDAGAFVTGNSKGNLGGALVLETTDSKQAKNTVSNLSLLLRASHTPGVSAIDGRFSGFSIRSPELGRQPLVVATAGSRIAIAYGLRAVAAALAESGQTLGDDPAFKEAAAALGGTPISGFVDGPAALRLAAALVPPRDRGFVEAKRYLNKIQYVAIGSEASGGLAKAKLIVGVGK